MAEIKDTTKNTSSTEFRKGGQDNRGRGGQGGRRPRREGGPDRTRDVEQKILDIRRVTRVVAGGRRMSFAVSMIIGDKNGVVGVGTGKGNDTALAITKALKDAKKNAIKIKRTENFSIPFDVSAKYNASKVMMFPNNGRGIVVGAALRDIAILAGLKDVSGKVVSGSKNKLNTARAAMKALAKIGTKHIFGLPKVEVTTPVEEAVPPVAKEVVKEE